MNDYTGYAEKPIYYTKSSEYTFNRQSIQHSYSSEEARAKGFHFDDNGWFKTSPRGDYTDKSIEELTKQGRIYLTNSGSIRIRYPLILIDGRIYEDTLVGDTWNDIADSMHIGKERVGYPTQKPLALLERIIKASSSEGDLVLDPFCGCGTAIIAAQRLNRNWIGIDISKDAYEISTARQGELPLNFTHFEYVTRNLDEVNSLNPSDFEKWVNGFYKAIKPMPDHGVDGITQNGIPIQTKAYLIKYPQVSEFATNIKHHAKVPQPVKHSIMVSQIGFDESARKRQYEVATEGIAIDFKTPTELLAGDGTNAQ